MGQYYKVVNIDKKQFIHPHKFGDGLKLLEFGCSSNGTLTGLALLLADGNGRGGGDLRTDNPDVEALVGSWAGDRIVITGDYADAGKYVNKLEYGPVKMQEIANASFAEGYQNPEEVNLYGLASHVFEDISEKVKEAMEEDHYIKEEMQQSLFDA